MTAQSKVYIASDVDVTLTITSGFTVSDIDDLSLTLTKGATVITKTLGAGELAISGSGVVGVIDRTDVTEAGYYDISLVLTHDSSTKQTRLTPDPETIQFHS